MQFIWQFQYFNKNELCTQNGEPLFILAAGQYNVNQGPDFTDARVIIGNTTWAGTIELHIKTGDWNRHKHHDDRNYNNVILHVVWEDDGAYTGHPSYLQQGVAVLELKSRVPKILLQRYEDLMQSAAFIPCQKSIQSVKDITWSSWKESLLAMRLMRKAGVVEEYLKQNNFHWEETFWWLLARNFGMKVNGEAFEAIARSLPLTLLARHKNQLHQLEALLMGQGGLLENNFTEKYPGMIQSEYRFLQRKYNLQPISMPLHLLRMRPGNFPAVRLAELAKLVHESVHLFARIKEAASANAIRHLFDITANDYWHYHYHYDEASSFRKKKIGEAMIDNIIINTVVPVLFAYGNYHNDEKTKWRALECLEQVRPEKNRITHGFRTLNIRAINARDSQALIELRNEFCEKRKCLECALGNAILKQPCF